MNFTFQAIGSIYSPFKTLEGMPIQSTGAIGVQGKIEMMPKYVEGLTDLEGFSHIILLYFFHKSNEFKLLATPFLDNKPHGVFATRAPMRPNQIGLSIVKLQSIEDNILHIENVDILNGTPLLDIKPYVPEFDKREAVKIGWLADNVHKLSGSKDNGRFSR